jgi:hypothetical protein
MHRFFVSCWNLQGWREDEEHPWTGRAPTVTRMLRNVNSSLANFQEFAVNNLEAVTNAFQDYKYILGPEIGKGQYNPIFLNQEMFTLQSEGGFYLSEKGEKTLGWDAQNERAVTWVCLKHRKAKNDQQLLCLNTHLDHIGYIARERETEMIIDFLNEWPESIPIIITLDGNFGLYRYNKSVAPKTRPYGMFSEIGFVDILRALYPVWPPYPTFHNYEGADYKPDEWNTWDIDRILIRNLRVRSGRIVHYPRNQKAPTDHHLLKGVVEFMVHKASDKQKKS